MIQFVLPIWYMSKRLLEEDIRSTTALRYDFKNDGKDPLRKIMAALKFSVVSATVSGGYETIVRQPAPNFSNAFVRCGKHLLLWTGATTTFTTAVLFLTNVRQKDTPLNYFLAANAASGVVYSITGNKPIAVGLAIFCGLGGALLKYHFLKGYDPLDHSDAALDVYSGSLKFENSPDVRYSNKN